MRAILVNRSQITWVKWHTGIFSVPKRPVFGRSIFGNQCRSHANHCIAGCVAKVCHRETLLGRVCDYTMQHALKPSVTHCLEHIAHIDHQRERHSSHTKPLPIGLDLQPSHRILLQDGQHTWVAMCNKSPHLV